VLRDGRESVRLRDRVPRFGAAPSAAIGSLSRVDAPPCG